MPVPQVFTKKPHIPGNPAGRSAGNPKSIYEILPIKVVKGALVSGCIITVARKSYSKEPQ